MFWIRSTPNYESWIRPWWIKWRTPKIYISTRFHKYLLCRSAKEQQIRYLKEVSFFRICNKNALWEQIFGKWNIFKLVYHCKVSRWSEICFARDIAKKSLNRLLLFLILKSSLARCTVEKGILKNFTNFTGKHLCWSLF